MIENKNDAKEPATTDKEKPLGKDPTVWESLVVLNEELETTFIQATDGTIIEPPDHQSFDATPPQTITPSDSPEVAPAPTTSASEGVILPPNTIQPAPAELENRSSDPTSVTPIQSPWDAIRPMSEKL